MNAKRMTGLLCIALAFVVGGLAWLRPSGSNARSRGPILGNVETLRAVYARWKEENARNGGRVVLPLAWNKGLSSEFTEASGRATLDLADGTLEVEVSDPCGGEALDVWLVENVPGTGRTVMPEPGDTMIRVGRTQPSPAGVALAAPIPHEALGDFELDLLVVTRPDRSPDEGGLLYGTPDLFQRLYSRDLRAASGAPGLSVGGLHLALLAPVPQDPPEFDPGLEELIAKGEDLFFNATLLGRGLRACAINPRAAEWMGVNVDRMRLLAFTLAGVLGAVAGIVVAPISLATYDMGLPMGLKGFDAAIIGGLVNPVGAVIGGLFLGTAESLTAGLISSRYKDAVAFILLIGVLLAHTRRLLPEARDEVGL